MEMNVDLDRIIAEAETARRRLDAKEKLSAILPQVRLLAEMTDNTVYAHWLDCEMFGLDKVPFAKKPRETAVETAGVGIFAELHQITDLGQMTEREALDKILGGETLPTAITKSSVAVLEGIAPSNTTSYGYDPQLRIVNIKLQLFERDAPRVLQRVRDFIHRYINQVWLESVTEKDNIALLGPNYRIVIDNLDALKTGVGQELMAALSNLRDQNPANCQLEIGCVRLQKCDHKAG